MTKLPHILFLASWYPNRHAPALGNFIQQHARAAALENRVSVVYASADKTLEEGKVEVEENHSGNLSEYRIYYGKITSALPLLSTLKKRQAYRDAVKTGIELATTKNGRADLLHLHVIWPAAVALLPLFDSLKTPLIISEHWSGYLPEDGNYKGIIQKNISKRIAEKAQHVTVVSQRMADAMKTHGLGKSFSILPNAVDTNLFHYKAKQEAEAAGIKLLHVSMLVDKEKNISGLLRVMKALEFHPKISLEIIGEGPERETLESLVQQIGILNQNVVFRGFCNAAEIATAMQSADALIMFSNYEGMPVTIIEAQCCGLPVIATKVGYIPNMVNETQGTLVDVSDEAGLKNAIVDFVMKKNTFDRAKIGNDATGKYSQLAVAQELNHLYASILQPK
ncbi:MAG: glycosyltransferase [Bacteroidota bacterium]|nr:glycosyltransferase [Bacteroidota bacterium]